MIPPTETTPLFPPNHQLHDHSYQSPTHSSDVSLILRASAHTFLFFLIELIGGYFAGSLAIMSDAAHLLSDLAGFAINFIALSVSRLPPNKHLSFGYARAEVLGALISILFIWALTALLVLAAVRRLFHPTPVDGHIMLVLGVMGLLVNITLGLSLGHSHDHCLHSHGNSHHSHDHHLHDSHSQHSLHDIESPPDHSHDHSHEHPQPSARALPFPLSLFSRITSTIQSFFVDILVAMSGADGRSITVRAAYLHILGDALQNVGIIFAALLLIWRPHWTILDPICTLLFAFIVFMTTRSLASETLTVLMEGTPPGLNLGEVYDSLRSIRGVRRVLDLHVWSISPRDPALSVHLYRDTDALSHDILKVAQTTLNERFGITHVTIQVNCGDIEGAQSPASRNGSLACVSSESLELPDNSR